MLCPFVSDWSVDGLERSLELERIKASMFFHQLKLQSMVNSFRKLKKEFDEQIK